MRNTQRDEFVRMATPGQLVQVMADVLGVPSATVFQYDRVLSENGLRSKSGRGTSAAKVTPRDAANLLIALATSPLFGMSAKDAIRNCHIYASLISSATFHEWSKGFADFGLPTLSNLSNKHSFGEALAALIDAAGKGETFRNPGKKYVTRRPQGFEIQFIGPEPSAQISAEATTDAGLSARLIYSGAPRRKGKRYLMLADFEKIPDLSQISSVSFRTIRALGILVSGGAAQSDAPNERQSRRAN